MSVEYLCLDQCHLVVSWPCWPRELSLLSELTAGWHDMAQSWQECRPNSDSWTIRWYAVQFCLLFAFLQISNETCLYKLPV